MIIEEFIYRMMIQGRNCQEIEPHLNLISNPNWKNEYGTSLLHRAVSDTSKYLPIVKTLVRLGANINEQDRNHESPLLIAMTNCTYKIVDFLITEGAEINSQSQTGKTVLHLCIEDIRLMDGMRAPGSWQKGYNLLNKMLRSGADPNQYDDSGETPFMLAVRINNFIVVKELLIFGGNVHLRNARSETCLHILLSGPGPNMEILFELIKRKSCVNCIDGQERSIMDLILPHYQEEIGLKTVKWFIKTVTLVNWESKVIFALSTNRNLGNLREFIDDCYTEVSRMRSFTYSDLSNLCHHALNNVNISQNDKTPAESILDEVFETLVKNCFTIYEDLITPYFSRKFLSEKFLNTDVYARDERNEAVILTMDINCLLLPQLSDQDLLNMARAYSKN